MTDQTTTITPERIAYDHLRSRAVAGEHVPEDELHRALGAAVEAEKRAEYAATLDAERAAHRQDEAADIRRRRKAGEKRLCELVTAVVEAREITAQAHQAMKGAVQEYDRVVQAQNSKLYALRDALTEAGYPTVQPRTGDESQHVHPERHPNGGGWIVWDGDKFGKAEDSRNAIPRFHNGLRAA
ncbi:hypothetical protein ACWIFB_07960 [Dietzia sp. NPDC055340]